MQSGEAIDLVLIFLPNLRLVAVDRRLILWAEL